jgi:hypothetical protein
MKRYEVGDTVWISPDESGDWLVDDEAVILEDFGDGYRVLQESERVPSYGSGHFVQDSEIEAVEVLLAA